MDHETSGAQEWTLPGYGRFSSRKPAPRARAVTNQAGTSLSKTAARNETQKKPQTSYAAVAAAPAVNTSVRARGTPRATRGRARGRRVYSKVTASRQSSHLLRDPPAKSKWRSGSAPSDVVNLPAAFGTFKYEFSGAARSSALAKTPLGAQGRHEVFEDISQKTGAYVKPPSYTDKIIHIWGEPPEVASAKDMIQKLIVKCNSFSLSQKKKTEWARINAYSANKEMGVDLKERCENMLLDLRKEPESASAFPEQLFFLWPKDGPRLKQSLGEQLEALDIIRAKFGCHIFLPKDLPDYICALGHSYDTMKQIVQLLRTKWSETVANSHVRSKVYIVEPPVAFRDTIVVENHTHFGKAILRGIKVEGAQLEQWHNRGTLIQTKNNARILGAIERSLQGVCFVRGHLRMRVNIGSFVLDEYRIPKDDKPSYGFEEFREMLLHEQTKGRLVPGLQVGQNELLARCFNATDLLEPYESISRSLEDAERAYSVNFEFLGSNNALLRLEAEFAKSPGAQEYEITQRRWLRPRKSGQSIDKRPPLQIGVIDFERADWQLEIKSLEFHETSSIDTTLKSFSHSIGFRRTATVNDISAKPQRKVLFPKSAPVSRFVEKTSIRYRLKGTKYILEIARYDEYSRLKVEAFPGHSPATIKGDICEVPSTSWGASIFNSSWDNLMGEQANLPVGHSARYNPDLNSFFPPNGSSDSGEKCAGFWDFVCLVKRVAEILGPARPPFSSEKAARKVPSNVEPSSSASAATKKQPPSSESSPKLNVKGLAGLLDADLGTLF